MFTPPRPDFAVEPLSDHPLNFEGFVSLTMATNDLMDSWEGQRDPTLGPATRTFARWSLKVAAAQTGYVTAVSRRERRAARNELADVGIRSTRLLGALLDHSGKPHVQLITDLSMATKGLVDALLYVQKGRVPKIPADFPRACAESAYRQAEAIGAWPLQQVAKALSGMLALVDQNS